MCLEAAANELVGDSIGILHLEGWLDPGWQQFGYQFGMCIVVVVQLFGYLVGQLLDSCVVQFGNWLEGVSLSSGKRENSVWTLLGTYMCVWLDIVRSSLWKVFGNITNSLISGIVSALHANGCRSVWRTCTCMERRTRLYLMCA